MGDSVFRPRSGARSPILLFALLASVALVAGGCGGDSEKSSDDPVKIAISARPDSLDPAMAITLPAIESLWQVYTPLLTYKREEGPGGTELIPALAEEMPEVSGDGRTYTLRLREGLTFSDGSEVRASDVERSIRRVLKLNSPGAGFFLGIEGADKHLGSGNPPAKISGIATDDESREVAITLNEPDSSFPNILATTFAAPVSSAAPDDEVAKEPPPGVGPFEIADARADTFSLVKVDDFSIDGIPEPSLDQLDVQVVSNVNRQTKGVIDGTFDYMQDAPATDLIDEVRSNQSDRYRESPSNSLSYFFLNETVAPFDDPRVRKAVAIAVDRVGQDKIVAGLQKPTCNTLPPVMPGYEKIEPCPFGDIGSSPDLTEARRLIKAAGAEGESVTVWGATEAPASTQAKAFVSDLNAIGLDAEARLVGFNSFIQAIGKPSTEAQAGGPISYQADYPHPKSILNLFDGRVIPPENNMNFGSVQVDGVDSALTELSAKPLGDSLEQWAKVDRELIDGAHLVPVGNQERTIFMSERMDFENCAPEYPVIKNDYGSFCLK